MYLQRLTFYNLEWRKYIISYCCVRNMCNHFKQNNTVQIIGVTCKISPHFVPNYSLLVYQYNPRPRILNIYICSPPFLFMCHLIFCAN
jgi:hypothetical protein